MVTHKDIPLCVLLQLVWRADSDGPNQAVQLILDQQLCQEHIPRSVMLLRSHGIVSTEGSVQSI